MNILLSTAYFAPIQYFAKICTAQKVIIEGFEHYPKQTYRNRCVIYSANGPLTLSIPTSKGDELKIFTKDIRIDHSMHWQKIHFKAIESAYRCSPFYEYYIDDLTPFFERNFSFLFDFNNEILIKLSELTGIDLDLSFTSKFYESKESDILDLRYSMHPKSQKDIPDPGFNPPKYRQVFEPKSGFFQNLSILDLLFNTGPNTLLHLQQ